LVVLDKLGFTPRNRVIADHIFRIASERNGRGAIIITSKQAVRSLG
jgi:hypothetical protein